MLSLHVDKRSLQVRKVAGIQQLNACIVIAVKGGRSVSASRIVGVGGRIKPTVPDDTFGAARWRDSATHWEKHC